ncbi:hypothetical protein RO3G_06929 [Rhizopus delemar RA 99-880]|uniref:Uncharacterized protein n=1 Tax=Rhizopus delemar (strain RA 99-880 / ATCC MYA-4621 / FGSC 9543 / NRRL 43880) TaxID=246409 RepID=I1C194_RHIO9|nr:hypothetical protein RO3G_06929 [Rhizopus delemar RA 99-880]|eukprot:EIE82224.1 hypothetical protein RO3G_06929 [Rhizopus delemar RA 99-880]
MICFLRLKEVSKIEFFLSLAAGERRQEPRTLNTKISGWRPFMLPENMEGLSIIE